METLPQPDAKQRQRAATLFQYGLDAGNKNNHDYAIKMLQEAIQLDPLELKYRQTLRAVQRLRFGNDPAKVGMLVGAKLQPIRLRIRSAKSRGQWMHVLELCEEAFQIHPWDVSACIDASEAAIALALPALAQWLMESVQAQAANDANYWRHMAKAYEANQAWQKSISCWERVKKLVPHDEEAAHQINALSASATIARSGLHEAVRRPEEGEDAEPELPEEAGSLRGSQALTPEQRFQKDVAADPRSARAYLNLAEHYRLQSRLDEARDVLAKGLQALPNEPLMRDTYATVQTQRLKMAVDALETRIREHPEDAEARGKLAKLKIKLDEYQLAELSRRVQANPDDLQLHYEYGLMLARQGQHDRAIQEFQVARSSSGLKVKSLIAAGQSFEATGVLKLAERSYQDALKSADSDDQELLNQIHYRMGRVFEDLGNLEAAEEHYNEVAANNYGYQDVAARLRSLNQRLSR